MIVTALIAAIGAVLRIWGAACLGYDTVHHGQMRAGVVMADGAYCYVRNPLYLGSWCMMAAISFVMPLTGALVMMTLMTVFFLRLILAEEAFLAGQLGQPYQDYLRAVPRLFPKRRTILSHSAPNPPVASRNGSMRSLPRSVLSASLSRWPSSPGAITTGS